MRKKLIILTLLISTLFGIINTSDAEEITYAKKESNNYCAKGDKILNHFETLNNPENPNKYLNSARYFYYQAKRLDMSNINALIGQARVALHQNRLKDAKNVLMIALNYNENNPKVNFYLGETFFREGEYTQALDYYMQAYTHGFKYDTKTNIQMATCYQKLDDIKKAKYHYEKVLNKNPNNIYAKEKLEKINNIKINKKLDDNI